MPRHRGYATAPHSPLSRIRRAREKNYLDCASIRGNGNKLEHLTLSDAKPLYTLIAGRQATCFPLQRVNLFRKVQTLCGRQNMVQMRLVYLGSVGSIARRSRPHAPSRVVVQINQRDRGTDSLPACAGGKMESRDTGHLSGSRDFRDFRFRCWPLLNLFWRMLSFFYDPGRLSGHQVQVTRRYTMPHRPRHQQENKLA